MSTTETQIRLAKRVAGLPGDDAWSTTHDPAPEPAQSEISVAVEYVSLDPAMRGWMNEGRSYIPPVELDAVMRAGGVGKVVASAADGFSAGDYVMGMTGAQTHYTGPTEGFMKIDPEIAPLSQFLGVLGMTGMTAYFGLLDVGKPKEGETVLVSAAAGAVGTVTGQIAKIKGCRAVGLAGGAEKCRFVIDQLGFDDCIDYKNEDVAKGIRRTCPDRVDVYFDNVGGGILEGALQNLNTKGRIVLCGAISQYNATDISSFTGPRNYMNLLVSRGTMEGFVVFDYASRYAEAMAEMAGWMTAGRLHSKEHVVEGIESFPAALRMLFAGENTGKLLIKV
ncbi:MAG: NADP-dependent oxidoreductase [Pseudomonadales bacterium]